MSDLHSGLGRSRLFERLERKTTTWYGAVVPRLKRACRALSDRVVAAWSTVRRAALPCRRP